MDDKIKLLSKKLELFKLTQRKTTTILEKRNVRAILRHKDALTNIVKETDYLKRDVEQEKLINEESVDDVAEWAVKIEEQIEEADCEIERLSKTISEIEEDEQRRKRERDSELRAREREEQLKFERTKLELQRELTTQTSPGNAASKPQVRLPKLEITKFNGTVEQWLPFWNKFKTEIDEANMPTITKFAHLQEFLEPHVRVEIDGLPFTETGYERAKKILADEYGKTSEIVHAYVRNVMALPIITGSNPAKVNQFYKTLMYNVQSLETLGKLQDVKGNVRTVLDKLKGIKADLVRGEVNWQEWNFLQLLESLKKWKDIHPVEEKETADDKSPRYTPGRNRSFYAKDQDQQHPKVCVYCESEGHKSINCDIIASVADRRGKLSEKRLCFNCTGNKHRAADCKSRSVCQACKRKHHTSICDKVLKDPFKGARHDVSAVCHPLVVIEVNGVKCRALLDTGAGSSYASAAFLDKLRLKQERAEVRRIEMMIGAVTKRVEIYNLPISSVKGDFRFEAEVTKVDRKELLTVNNPKYGDLIKRFPHLRGVVMDDVDSREQLPVHVILGASEYARIKTGSGQRVGRVGDPVAEKTKLGWSIMSPGVEGADESNMFLAQTSAVDYDELCRLDVLGLEDVPTGDQHVVYDEFREQLKRDHQGWYETGLPWKGDHPPLPCNETGSLRRLKTLTTKLEKADMMKQYDEIIKMQKENGIVEKATEPAVGVTFYIPHKPVTRETAASTKLRVVYDASAREHQQAPSLNECLEVGPPLQNQLWEVLVRNRFRPVAVAGDLKQAFLQVRIKSEDRDTLRFHWYADIESKEIETLRFSRALFGLAPSPFLLGGVIQQHLELHRADKPGVVNEIERSLYVDDLIMGECTVEKAKKLKESAVEVFEDAKFELHKWASNDRELEGTAGEGKEDESSYAKQQLGTAWGESSLLGLTWDKASDTIGVTFPKEPAEPTKRGILAKVARIFDPLGIVAPVTLGGKLQYRDACDEKTAWDSRLSNELTKRWKRWESNLPTLTAAPRSIPKHREEINDITLHAFGDASGKGVAAAVYAVVQQPSGISKGLVTARARLAKKGLTIPRLELVSAHMAVNLAHNVREALEGSPVSRVCCWSDSTVALHWIRNPGDHKQFVRNRVRKIRERGETTWRHVGTKNNPADLGSRSGNVDDNQLWWSGPTWLESPEHWPKDIVTTANEDTLAETRATKTLFNMAVQERDVFDEILEKWDRWKALRICAWVARFAANCRVTANERKKHALTTEELEAQRKFWERRARSEGEREEHYAEDQLQLNLQPNRDGALECRGRIQGHYPVYLNDKTTYAGKVVQQAHEDTLHGGVGLTMAKVRDRYWVPRLRRLTKKVVRACHGCRRFQARALQNPPPGTLPRDRTVAGAPFKVVGVDYAGPLRYKKSKNGA